MREYEQLIDAAFAKAGEVAGALVLAKNQHNLSSVVGQQVFAAIGASQLGVTSARGHVVDAHRALDKLAKQLGIDVLMYGDVRKDPSDGVFTGA